MSALQQFSFALKRPDFATSIFCGVPCYEVVDPEMCNGFIVNKMGIKFHKTESSKICPTKTSKSWLSIIVRIILPTLIK